MTITRWFRLYDEILDDPKIQRLPCEDRWQWINLLCLANRNEGRLPPIEDIAFALRIGDISVARSLVDRLTIAGLIDVCKGGPIGWYIAPHNWDKRQFKSDTSTERVKRFRDRFRNVAKPFHETPPESESESESEREKTKAKKIAEPAVSAGVCEQPKFALESQEPKPKPQPVRKRRGDPPVDYPADFQSLFLAYPQRRRGGRPISYRHWQKLSEVERKEAVDRLPAYLASRGEYVQDLERYVSHRAWEAFAPDLGAGINAACEQLGSWLNDPKYSRH